MDHFSDFECIPVIPCNPEGVSDSFPPYLVTPISIMDFLVGTQAMPFTSESFDLKIIDFGNSFSDQETKPPPNTPISIRAPEVTFCELTGGEVGSSWDKSVDIWAAACTLYGLNFGHVLFYGMGKGDAIIYRTIQLAGLLPPSWVQYWDLEKYSMQNKKSSNIDPDTFWADRASQLIKPDISDSTKKEIFGLIGLLRKMLRIDPDERPGISELWSHSWLAGQKPELYQPR